MTRRCISPYCSDDSDEHPVMTFWIPIAPGAYAALWLHPSCYPQVFARARLEITYDQVRAAALQDLN